MALRQPQTISANSVIVRDQLVCQGNAHFSGDITFGANARLLIRPIAGTCAGNSEASLTFTRDGICARAGTRSQLLISDAGIHIDGGFSLGRADEGAVVVTSISRAISSASTDSELPTARAVQNYVDAQLLGARFGRLDIDQIESARGLPITVRGPIMFDGAVEIRGPLALGFAHLTSAQCTFSFDRSLVFIDGAREIECAPADSQVGAAALIAQFINCGNTDALLRFAQGSARLRAQESARFALLRDAECDASAPTRAFLRCYSPADIFFPTRAIHIASYITQGSSVSICTSGCLAAVGAPSDGTRGCAHLLYRTCAGGWERACNKLIATSGVADLRNQGRFVSLAGALAIAFANDCAVWIYDIARASPFACAARAILPVVPALAPAEALAGISLSADGSELEVFIATAGGGAFAREVYDVRATSGASPILLRARESVDAPPGGAISAGGRTALRANSQDGLGAIEVLHNGAQECAISFPRAVRASAICANGSSAIVCLVDGTVWNLY